MRNIIIPLCFFLFISCNYSNPHQADKKKSLIDSLSHLLSKDSLDISLLNARAKQYLYENKLQFAKSDIDNAYSIFKNDITTLLTRGDIYYKLNQTKISKESWERCLKLDPNNITCRENLTSLLCAVRHPNCQLMIDTLSLLNNGVVSPLLIAYLKELKEYDSALNLLHNLLTNDSTSLEVLSLLSVIYSDTSNLNKYYNMELAEKYFNKTISLYPNNYQVYYNFGKHKQNISEYNDALNYYKLALNIDSSQKNTYYNMGFCYMQLEDYQKGIDYFTEAISIDNSFLLAYHARAYLYELMNNTQKAQVDWKNCLMLNPSYIPALQGLSE